MHGNISLGWLQIDVQTHAKNSKHQRIGKRKQNRFREYEIILRDLLIIIFEKKIIYLKYSLFLNFLNRELE